MSKPSPDTSTCTKPPVAHYRRVGEQDLVIIVTPCRRLVAATMAEWSQSPDPQFFLDQKKKDASVQVSLYELRPLGGPVVYDVLESEYSIVVDSSPDRTLHVIKTAGYRESVEPDKFLEELR